MCWANNQLTSHLAKWMVPIVSNDDTGIFLVNIVVDLNAMF
jgi:hypothetical protein